MEPVVAPVLVPQKPPAKAAKERPAQAVAQAGVSLPQKRPKPVAPKGTALPKKLIRFDYDLMEFVRKGDNTSDRLLLLTGVDPLQFAQRADFLCSKGYLCRDSANPSVFRLGINGYEEIAKRRDKEEKRARKSEPAGESIIMNRPQADSGPAKQVSVRHDASAQPADSILRNPLVFTSTGGSGQKRLDAGDEVDLFDLLRRGSPKNGNGSQIPQVARATQARHIPFEEQVRELGGKDSVVQLIEKTTQSGACELCRAPFKLSANPAENNPKYGNCFCGASYHKDCYESLAHSSDGACVRCGKKLRVQMDRASEDAVKAIKKLFD